MNHKLKNIIKEAYAELFNNKEFDPKDPEVLIRGYGRMTKSQLKNNIISRLKDIIDEVERDNYESAAYLYNKGVVKYFINGMVDVENQMNTPVMKGKITKKLNKLTQQKNV